MPVVLFVNGVRGVNAAYERAFDALSGALADAAEGEDDLVASDVPWPEVGDDARALEVRVAAARILPDEQRLRAAKTIMARHGAHPALRAALR